MGVMEKKMDTTIMGFLGYRITTKSPHPEPLGSPCCRLRVLLFLDVRALNIGHPDSMLIIRIDEL